MSSQFRRQARQTKVNAFHHLVTITLAVAACARQPAAAPVRAPAHRTTAQRTSAAQAADFAAAWALWTHGDRAEGTTQLQKVVRELRAEATVAKPFTVVSGVAGTMTLATNSDGSRAVALSPEAAYWFDGNGVPLHYDGIDAHSVAFVPGTTLAVLTDPDLTIIDAATFAPVLHAPNVIEAKASPSGKLLVYVEAVDKRTTLHVWEVATKREVRTFDLGAGESWQLFSLGFAPDDKDLYFELRTASTEDELGNMTDAGEEHLVVVDEAGHRLDFPARLGNSRPSFSSDGRYIAYGYPVFSEARGTEGKTSLIDRTTRKQTVSTAVDFPTATQFSKDGKHLIVGALRKLRILDVPSLRVAATTPDMRPRYYDDDLQDIGDIEILGADKAFWARTADGTTALFRFPSGKLVWKGPEGTTAEPVSTTSGYGFTVDGSLVSFDDSFAISHRALSAAELDQHAPDALETLGARLESTVCTIGDRVFPIAACH